MPTAEGGTIGSQTLATRESRVGPEPTGPGFGRPQVRVVSGDLCREGLRTTDHSTLDTVGNLVAVPATGTPTLGPAWTVGNSVVPDPESLHPETGGPLRRAPPRVSGPVEHAVVSVPGGNPGRPVGSRGSRDVGRGRSRRRGPTGGRSSSGRGCGSTQPPRASHFLAGLPCSELDVVRDTQEPDVYHLGSRGGPETPRTVTVREGDLSWGRYEPRPKTQTPTFTTPASHGRTTPTSGGSGVALDDRVSWAEVSDSSGHVFGPTPVSPVDASRAKEETPTERRDGPPPVLDV